MPPQNPNQQPTPTPTNPSEPGRYEFFMNPPKQPKQRIKLGGSLGARIGVIVGVGILVMIILTVVVNIATSGNTSTQSFVTIAQEQNEMIRISGLATYQAVNRDTKNFAANAQTTLTSAQQQLLTYLLGLGIKPSPNQLALKKNSATDTSLTTAKAASLYDQTYLNIMQTQLSDYSNSVKVTFNGINGPKGRKLLNNEYIGAQLLLKQLQAAQNN